MSNLYTLRVCAELDGPVAGLILVANTRRTSEVWQMDLPYLLWQSLGTRATATFVTQLYRFHAPAVVRRLGPRTIQRIVVGALELHHEENLRQKGT